MITMENVCKSYRVAKRNAGFGAACKALFHREYEVIEALKGKSSVRARDSVNSSRLFW